MQIGGHILDSHQVMCNNPLENTNLDSQDDSFFMGSSFIVDQGKALANISTHNLEELLHQADDVDPEAFLIRGPNNAN